MRIGIVRTDIARIYLSDVENASQRDFSSQPKGQSRYFVHPTDAQLQSVLNKFGVSTLLGTNTSTFNTTGSNATKLNIKTTGSAFTQVAVRSGASVTAAQVVSDLNTAFKNAGVAATARVSGTSVAIDTNAGGPTVALQLSASSPSAATLQTVLGLATTLVTTVTLAALKAVIYPSATTVNVSSASILALGSFSSLSMAEQAALVGAIQDLVAPRLVETGPAIRSFAYGILSKMASPSFQPGGSRSKLPAGIACVVLADDGTTPFVAA